MTVGYTALLFGQKTQQMLRERFGARHPGTVAINTPRIVDVMNASRADKRDVVPVEVRIVGLHEAAETRVLLLEVNGEIRRRDGCLYNVVMHVPHGGLHMKTIDELAQAVLATVPEAGLYNIDPAEKISALPAFIAGLERPRGFVSPRAHMGIKAPAAGRFQRTV